MVAGLIYAIGGFIEFIVGLRLLFRLIGANPGSAFVDWVYDWSTPFVAPFAGIFGQESTIEAGPGVAAQSIFDWTALIALIFYALLTAFIGGTVMRFSRGRGNNI
jgi:YggT family protein